MKERFAYVDSTITSVIQIAAQTTPTGQLQPHPALPTSPTDERRVRELMLGGYG
jgi:hypothetical protein